MFVLYSLHSAPRVWWALFGQGGAEYDGRKEKLTEHENFAKSNKEGLWAQSDGETPAQYKARIKREQPAGTRR